MINLYYTQHAKKVVSDSQGLVDLFFWEIEIKEGL